jgi:LPS export ABC transporter protein LptC
MRSKSFLFLCIFFIICFSLPSCETAREEVSDDIAKELLNKEYLQNVNVDYSDSGRLQLRIKAPTMIRHLESSNIKEEFPDGFFAEFYDNYGGLVNTLASKYAIRQTSDGVTTMRDSVVFASINQEILKTSELIWDERSGKLRTDKFVRIIRKDEIIQGFGFETDQSFKRGSLRSVDGQLPSDKLFENSNE